MQTSGSSCREIAASYSTVIVREGGRSSIPETVVIEPKSRGVLDPPPSRGTTTCFVAAPRRLRNLHIEPQNPRQHAPAKQRRLRRRQQLRRPARQFLQRVGIHHHAAP